MWKQSRIFFNSKIGNRISCGYSVPTIWEFDHIENKHALSRRKYYMKILFCESIGDHRKNIIAFGEKKVLPLTNEEVKSHQDAKACYV